MRRLIRRVPLVCGGFAAAVGAIVLMGWWSGLRRVTSVAPGLPPMVANTALMAALLGTALLLSASGAPAAISRRGAIAGKACAGIVAAVAAVTVVEYLFGLDLQLDHILISTREPLMGRNPDRPSPQTAVAFLLAATALLIIDPRSTRGQRLAELLALASWLIPLMAILGYLFGAAALYEIPSLLPYTGMGIPTCLALLALSAGIVACTMDDGGLSILMKEDSGGTAARHFAAWILVFVPVVCAIAIGARLGFYAAPFASALVVLSGIVAGSAFVLRVSGRLSRLDAKRREADVIRARLASLVSSSDDVIIAETLDGRITDWNFGAERILGYSAAEMIGRGSSELLPPDHPEEKRKEIDAIRDAIRHGQRAGSFEAAWRRKGGHLVPVFVTLSPLLDSAGHVFGVSAIAQDITERKQAQDQLRHAHERLDLALRGADLATWDWNVESGEVIFNPRWAEMRGFRPDEIKPDVESWISGIYPEDLPLVQKMLDDYFEGRVAEYKTEHRVRTKSGAWRWTLDQGKVFARDDRGRPIRMVGTELDITSQKRLEEELRLSEAKSSGILAISADAIISVDDNQRITMFNEGAVKIFGHSKEEAIGAPLDMLIPERLRATHREHVARFAAGQEASRRMGERRGGLLGLRKNGEEFHADAAISRLAVAGTRILTVALRDVSEQRRSEDESAFLAEIGSILASTLELEATLASIGRLVTRALADVCVVYVLEGDHEVRRIEATTRDPSQGWIRDYLVQNPIDRRKASPIWAEMNAHRSILLERISPEWIASYAQSEVHARALRAMNMSSAIMVPLVVRGELIGAMSLISSEPSRAYTPADVCFAEQVAQRAAFAIENAQLYDEAQRAIQTRDDVLGIVAHDLRSPLGTILLQAEIIREFAADPERRLRRQAEKIERSAQRMNRLIQDLLDVTRMEAGRLPVEQTRVGAGELVGDTVEVQRSLAAAASLELHVDVARDLPDVWADRDRLQQVFENLIGNAIKFTRPGGTITAGAALREGAVLFWVTDTGAGIASEDLPRVFDRFWQARKPGRQGAGLGLPIVKGIVEAHGGRIWVESTPGSGSTFFFTIPPAPRAEERPASHAP